MKEFEKRAREIAEAWIRDQLRPEGRAGIYIDDEAALVLDIAQALSAASRAGFLRGRSDGEDLAGFIADTLDGICRCDSSDNHKCRDCLAEELLNEWDNGALQPDGQGDAEQGGGEE